MKQYIEDICNELHAFSDIEFVSKNPKRYERCITNAREALTLLDATRRKLIEEKRELAKQLLNIPHWVRTNKEKPGFSSEYVVRIRDAACPTTLYYNTLDKLWYGEDHETYAVTHWLKGLEMPEV